MFAVLSQAAIKALINVGLVFTFLPFLPTCGIAEFTISMGFSWSRFFPPAGYDEPNPATGITPRQKDTVQRTWGVVRQNTKNNGIQLFLRVFEEYPEYQKLFPGFADVAKSELAENKKLLGHAMAVMYGFNSIVDSLDDPETLVQILDKIGVSHRPRNLNPTHFQNLAAVIVSFLADALNLDGQEKEAWRLTLDVAMSIIVKAMEGSS